MIITKPQYANRVSKAWSCCMFTVEKGNIKTLLIANVQLQFIVMTAE